MESEITYAEVKFNKAPSPADPEASSKRRTPGNIFQKCTPWVPWAMSGFLMLLSITLLVVIIAILLNRSPKKELLKSLFHNSTDWYCLLKSREGKEQELSCCKEGWEQSESSCYYFSKDRMTWNGSRTKCRGMGSDLVVINSEAEQEFLMAHKDNVEKENLCIGLTDQEEKGKWHWVDKTPINPAAKFWRVGEPSNDNENCVVMHINKDARSRTKENWNDVKCNEMSHHYVCESMKVIF